MKVSEVNYYKNPYLHAADLPKPAQVTIAKAEVLALFNQQINRKEEKIVLSFVGKEKKLVLGKERAEQMVKLGGDDTDGWPGLVIRLTPATSRSGKATIHIGAAGHPPAKDAGGE
jgi:hypothetical protein